MMSAILTLCSIQEQTENTKFDILLMTSKDSRLAGSNGTFLKTWGPLGGLYVVSKYSCRYGVAKEKVFLAQKATVKFRELLGLDSCCSNKLCLFPENCMWFEIFIHVKMSVNFALFPLL